MRIGRAVAVVGVGVALLAGGMPTRAWCAEPYFKIEVVNGPDEAFTYCHSPTIVQLANGDLLCAWYAKEEHGDKQERYCRKPAGESSWTPPKVLVDTPGLDDWNPVLWQDPTGKVWCFYARESKNPLVARGKDGRAVETNSAYLTAQVDAITSTDDGATWSEPARLVEGVGYWVRCAPLVTSKGAWIVPGYDERDWTSHMYISTDQGAAWEVSESIATGDGYRASPIQPSVIELSDGRLRALCRIGYWVPSSLFSGRREWKTDKTQHIQESYSSDDGRTWSKPKAIGLPNGDASVAQCKLKNGHVVLIFNNSFDLRTPVSAALSRDEGATWAAVRDLEVAEGANRLDYPSVIQTADGLIHAVYRNRADMRIKHVVFDEEWVAAEAAEKGSSEEQEVRREE